MQPVKARKKAKVINQPEHTRTDGGRTATGGGRPPPHCHPTVGDG